MVTKQGINVNFTGGLDTKTDPFQVILGKFLVLVNSIFTVGNRLTKRNGFGSLTTLPAGSNASYLTTFNDNLTAVGDSLIAYNETNQQWVNKGTIQPVSLDVLPLVRNTFNQTQCDSVLAPNGLVCTAYTETTGAATSYKYAILDSVTGQSIVNPSVIPIASGAISGSPRVFLLGNYFVIVFTNTISAVTHLQYVAISIARPTQVTANHDIAAVYVPKTTVSWDGFVVNKNLYIAYNTTTGGQAIKVTYLTAANAGQGLGPVTAVTFAGQIATMMSVTADVTNTGSPTIYVSYYDLASTTGFMLAVNSALSTVMNPVEIIAAGTVLNITSAAQNGTCTAYYEVSNVYSYDSIASNYIKAVAVTPLGFNFRSVFSSGAGTITASSATGLVNGMFLIDNTTPGNIAAGTTFTHSGTTLTLSINTAGNSASTPGDVLTAATLSVTTIVRSVGLASKAFIIDGTEYFLGAYSSPYQPSYFLINGSQSLQASPVIVSRLAYQNGGGYLTLGLPAVSVNGSVASMAYLFKDLIAAVNKNTNVPAGTQVNGIYSQTGVNEVSFDFDPLIDTAEIGQNLHTSGGFLWGYDGNYPVENNFLVYPDSVEVTTATGSGGLIAQQYFYQATYEWTDNQGNAFRSAPSIPVSITTTTSSSTNTINVPTLRLTYKVPTPVKIVLYRWSTAQQTYYQVTSITTPTQNSTTTDQVAIVDALADSAILGNNIIYTNGGVIEDVATPATKIVTLFDTRLWLVDAEDPNLLWFSKQVIEATPVEMSDLLTYYIAPNTGTTGSTGPVRALAPMDDKLIIFKKDAIYYINGTGPDNTGANSQYSQPIFITSAVGCSNQQSIVLTPNGLMFQSDKGIWLLGRDLSSSYIGAPVEIFNDSIIQSAVTVPQTNQVRFTLDTGQILMFDYYYQQWGTFVGTSAISSCIYHSLHTTIDKYGRVAQETPGQYLDNSGPVLMSFTTSWINVASLQGFERFYWFYLLGTYQSPHLLSVGLAYNYVSTVVHQSMITPHNFSASTASPYGDQPAPFGSPTNIEQWKIHARVQKCQSFRITIDEIYDQSLGEIAGAGFTMSGLTLVVGVKRSTRPIPSRDTVGLHGSS